METLQITHDVYDKHIYVEKEIGPELEAMSLIWSMLKPLQTGERQRILMWLESKHQAMFQRGGNEA